MFEKRPRHYASEIIGAPSNERESEYQKVPEHYREWVREIVTSSEQIQANKNKHAALKQSVGTVAKRRNLPRQNKGRWPMASGVR